MNLNKYQNSVNSNFVSSLVHQKLEQKKNPKSIATVGVFKFRRYEKGITFSFKQSISIDLSNISENLSSLFITI